MSVGVNSQHDDIDRRTTIRTASGVETSITEPSRLPSGTVVGSTVLKLGVTRSRMTLSTIRADGRCTLPEARPSSSERDGSAAAGEASLWLNSEDDVHRPSMSSAVGEAAREPKREEPVVGLLGVGEDGRVWTCIAGRCVCAAEG